MNGMEIVKKIKRNVIVIGRSESVKMIDFKEKLAKRDGKRIIYHAGRKKRLLKNEGEFN